MTNTIKRDADLNEHGNIDPAQCPYRETCPDVMACVTEFLVELARKDWFRGEEANDEQGDDHERRYTDPE